MLEPTRDARSRKAAQAIDALCLDKRFAYDGWPDKIEICDLLTRDGALIHVKQRGSSSTLSHLFSRESTALSACSWLKTSAKGVCRNQKI